uniref:Uncharacterized protein n=1 Tax=Anguilla anguilla TaxID=7936 RepID=A0A0E9SPS0_ANGAN
MKSFSTFVSLSKRLFLLHVTFLLKRGSYAQLLNR